MANAKTSSAHTPAPWKVKTGKPMPDGTFDYEIWDDDVPVAVLGMKDGEENATLTETRRK